MTTPEKSVGEEFLDKLSDSYNISIFKEDRENLDTLLTQTLQTERQRRGEMYAEGYKQGKFDAEVTAEYGEPEVITQHNNPK